MEILQSWFSNCIMMASCKTELVREISQPWKWCLEITDLYDSALWIVCYRCVSKPFILTTNWSLYWELFASLKHTYQARYVSWCQIGAMPSPTSLLTSQLWWCLMEIWCNACGCICKTDSKLSLSYHMLIGTGDIVFPPWPFRPKGYCFCLRLYVCLSVCPSEELSMDTNYPIWRRQERRSKYAVQLALWQLRSNSPKTSVPPSVNFCLSAR